MLLGQEMENKTSQNSEVISTFMRLSTQQLFDTAEHYYSKNSYDTALVAYNLLINAIPKNVDFEQQMKLMKTYGRLTYIYHTVSDFRMAFDCLMKRFLIAEKYNLEDEITKCYINFGLIYSYMEQKEISKEYYSQALNLCKDSAVYIILLNNMGLEELPNGNLEVAYDYFDKALQISRRNNDTGMLNSLINIAAYHQLKGNYDSAFHYYRLSFDRSISERHVRAEAIILAGLGKMFFELNKIDSALHYIDLSNKVASKNKILNSLADNFLVLSEIEGSKGRYKNALEHYKTYTNLKDSIFNANVFGSINFMQRQYEVSKTNQIIEELEIDRQIKENTIHYQKIILLIVISVSLLMGIVLFIIVLQNKKLRTAYNVLVEKNVEIIKIEKKSSTKKQNNSNVQKDHDDLFKRILNVMEDPSVYCEPSFTMDKLVLLVQSNHTYVHKALKSSKFKGFPKFVNSYRVREAQRIFMNPNNEKYTIESVSDKVGFKSRTSFYSAFKEVTGVSPKYYIKTMKEEG